MKANGSVYVSVVFAAFAGYFAYQSWFNPQRAVKRQLGELAEALSVPAGSQDAARRLARTARLRRYFAADARISLGPSGPEFATRDAFVTAIGEWVPPPGGLNVAFVDVQIALDSATDARAYLTVEITGLDTRTGEPGRDEREARVGLGMRDGAWVITSAESGPARTE